jgi:hypothetical protein
VHRNRCGSINSQWPDFDLVTWPQDSPAARLTRDSRLCITLRVSTPLRHHYGSAPSSTAAPLRARQRLLVAHITSLVRTPHTTIVVVSTRAALTGPTTHTRDDAQRSLPTGPRETLHSSRRVGMPRRGLCRGTAIQVPERCRERQEPSAS